MKIVDLTHGIYHGMPTFPLDPKTGVLVHHTIDTMKYNITQLIISTHLGTHLDAPYHFFDEGRTVDKVDLTKCVGKAFVLKLEGKGPGSIIDIEDLKPYEKYFTKGSKVIINLGWYKYFGKKEFYNEMPAISVNCARWIAERGIDMIGLDIPGVNPVDWEEVHKSLLAKEIVIVEALNNLDALDEGEVFFVAAPLKIEGRDGSPVRAFAIVDMAE